MSRLKRSLTPDQLRSLSPDTLREMTTPAKYFASKAIGSKKFYVFMDAETDGKTYRTSISKGYLTFDKADAFAKTMQEKENASVERFKSMLEKANISLPELA